MGDESFLPLKQPLQNEPPRSLTRTIRVGRLLLLTVITAALGMSLLSCSCSHSPIRLHLVPLQKKIHPPHPKKLHHGTVEYLTEDTGEGRYYRREFTIPCGYGMLAFNIGPAKENLPYSFDVYDDAYIFSDNAGLCLLYPSYRGYQNGTEPFWEVDDPTFQQVPLGPWTKVSHKINKKLHTKEINAAVKARGGDYVIMDKGNFYDPRYYQRLKAVVNSWSSSINVLDALSTFHEIEMATA
ncbi:hypothetical protein FisN_11Lh278 [Fistulifera solaris]|uniref:Uncharacterized protein n=1 Tax=Fistulifera solaris TaxID=1519565 RepID=A0A1Z5J6X2_FISSO|nr:hypothetical protein FisN_11Lh278 [Fistulifera solaris]|eukprot:GAX09754.1 hypothetical protein FisN_11Lh278 [Fistulifera solaris]